MPFNYDNYAKRFEENPAIFFLSIFVCFWDCIKVRSSNYSIEVFTWWSKASLQSKMFSFSEFMPRKRDSNWTFDFRMFWKWNDKNWTLDFRVFWIWNDSDVFLSSFTLLILNILYLASKEKDSFVYNIEFPIRNISPN